MSGAQHRPAKRTRLSDDDPSPSQGLPLHSSSAASSSSLQFERHPEIWFDDGNIVLVARTTAFRIYRGLLASQSTIFSDMFASSTSSSAETFDGCPVVHLSDSPSDLVHLLRVLLPTAQINYRPTKDDPVRTFDEVSAVIRLAHKYLIPQVQTQALTSLREYDFTNSFAAFSGTPPELEIVVAPVHAIGAVNLARLTETPSMLPLALYRCAYLGNAILDGWTRADGTVERLSDADLRRCLDARVSLANERFFLVSRILDPTPSAKCRRTHRCGLRLQDVHTRTMRLRRIVRAEEEVEGGVLRDWELLIGAFRDSKSLCGPCIEELVRRSLHERKRVWNRLPEIFAIDVEGWGEPDVEPDSENSDDDDSANL